MKIKFKKWNCIIKIRYYQNKRIALQLIDEIDGSPVAVATVNLPEIKLKKNQTIIKDYSENEGMLNSFQNVGLVKKIIGSTQTGFVVCPIIELNMEKLQED